MVLRRAFLLIKRIMPKSKSIGRYFKSAVHTALILWGLSCMILLVDMKSFSVAMVSLDTFTTTIISLYLALIILYVIFDIGHHVLFTNHNSTVTVIEKYPGLPAKISSTTLSDASVVDLKRKSVHESGHAVAALCLGHCPEEVAIHENGGFCKLPLPKTCDISADTWKNHVIIDYCGAVAETMIYGSYCSGCLVTRESDWALAEEHIRTYLLLMDPSLPKLTHSPELDSRIVEVSGLFFKEAEELLSGKEDLIRDFADLLFKNMQAKKKDIHNWALSHSIALSAEKYTENTLQEAQNE